MDFAIKTEGLSKAFGSQRVLRNINLQIPQGAIFGFIGPNGAGKTTTIRLLLGILQPTSGRAEVLGMDSWHQGVAIRKQVGYVAEQNTFYPFMRVEELIRFNAGLYASWDSGKAEKMLNSFDLPRRAKIKELSKGMRTQLALTLALSVRPRLLVLDEPTGGLDPVWRRQFLQAMTREVAESETTVFLSSHILSDVERVADWLGIIAQGQLKTVRRLDDLKYNERTIRVVFQGNPPAGLLEMKGISKIQHQGSGYLITVTDRFDEIYASLNKAPHFVLEVVEQDLESIFLEYAAHGGEEID